MRAAAGRSSAPSAPTRRRRPGPLPTLPSAPSLASELLREQRVDDGGVALPLHLLHHLADEEAHELPVAAAVALHLGLAAGEHGVHDRLDRALVGDLGEPLLPHDLGRLAALAEDRLQRLLRAWATDGPG